jgi:competence protein ComEA
MDSRSVRYGVLALVVALALGLGWSGLVRYQAEKRAAVAAAAETAEPAEPARPAQTVEPAPAASAARPEPDLVIHVAGAVANPGVYHLPAGARISDAIAAAGGTVPDSAPEVLNLAARVADGDKIYVYTKQEQQQAPAAGPPPGARGATQGTAATRTTASGGGTGGANGGKVSVNTATAEQLDALPGVTPTVARAIVEYRTKNGAFKRFEDLEKVKGIGPATREKIKQNATL